MKIEEVGDDTEKAEIDEAQVEDSGHTNTDFGDDTEKAAIDEAQAEDCGHTNTDCDPTTAAAEQWLLLFSLPEQWLLLFSLLGCVQLCGLSL